MKKVFYPFLFVFFFFIVVGCSNNVINNSENSNNINIPNNSGNSNNSNSSGNSNDFSTDVNSVLSQEKNNLAIANLSIGSTRNVHSSRDINTAKDLCIVKNDKIIPLLFKNASNDVVSLKVNSIYADPKGTYVICNIAGIVKYPVEINEENIDSHCFGNHVDVAISQKEIRKSLLIDFNTGKVIDLGLESLVLGDNYSGPQIASDKYSIYYIQANTMYKINKDDLYTAIPLNNASFDLVKSFSFYSKDSLYVNTLVFESPSYINRSKVFDKNGIKTNLVIDNRALYWNLEMDLSNIIQDTAFYDNQGDIYVASNWSGLSSGGPDHRGNGVESFWYSIKTADNSLVIDNSGEMNNPYWTHEQYPAFNEKVRYLKSGEYSNEPGMAEPVCFTWNNHNWNVYYLTDGYLSFKIDESGKVYDEFTPVSYPEDYESSQSIGFSNGYRYYFDEDSHIVKVKVSDGTTVRSSFTLDSAEGYRSEKVFNGTQLIVYKHVDATTVNTFVVDLTDLTKQPELLSTSKVDISYLTDFSI